MAQKLLHYEVLERLGEGARSTIYSVVDPTTRRVTLPGGRQATGPTARQFAALKKQVALLNKKLTALTKDEKVVKTAARAAVVYIGACFLDSNGNIQNGLMRLGNASAAL